VDKNTYINILSDTLVKKCKVLDYLIEITLKQEDFIDQETLDLDAFEQTLSEKEKLIEQLNQLDEGFERIYEHVSEEISKNKLEHKDQILFLQELIKQVSEKSVNLQIAEVENKGKLEIYFSARKKEIRNFKISSQTASNYYKNMANQYHGESYFLDKKK
jgi:tRNA U55 pseudouridine synthase TruB